MIAVALALLVGASQPEPLLQPARQALQAAVAANDLHAVIVTIPAGTDAGRHSVCALAGTAAALECFRHTVVLDNGQWTATHTAPAEYDGDDLAAIIAAERAWTAAGADP